VIVICDCKWTKNQTIAAKVQPTAYTLNSHISQDTASATTLLQFSYKCKDKKFLTSSSLQRPLKEQGVNVAF